MVKEKSDGGEGDFLQGYKHGDCKEILERCKTPEVSISGEDEFQENENKNFKDKGKVKRGLEIFWYFSLKTKEEGDKNGENKNRTINYQFGEESPKRRFTKKA